MSHWLKLLIAIALVGCGPMDETPGLRLGGAETEPPASFEFVSEHAVIQLAAQGAVLPRVVNIWGVGLGDSIFVWTGPETGWGQRVEKRPDVRVRVGESAYPLRAARVDDAAERERVYDAFMAKYGEELKEMYGRAPTIGDFELFYRLSPRS
jgi:hypothetical protein